MKDYFNDKGDPKVLFMFFITIIVLIIGFKLIGDIIYLKKYYEDAFWRLFKGL